ncbi:hypothetical protein VLK31_07220 [Variovorax sp. H27-G14]|uniref:hypothetical protein n=1 Tax=Variovorax sp. H27-G14 TaxID=3111914 RepID=UPI0038FCD24D
MANEQQAGVLVRGPGTGTSDSIPAALSDGELVIPADDVRRFGAAHLMRMVKQMGSQLPEPGMKEGVQHAAAGGMIADPYGQPTNDVTRVGNSYSGGNVVGSVAINGQAPGGTVSTVDSYKAPPPPAAPPVLGTPAAQTPLAPKPVIPGAQVAPAPAAATPAAPSGLGIISSAPVQQVRSAFAPPVAPAPAAPAPAPQVPADRRLGLASGGLVDERDLNRAAFGFFPQMPTGGTPVARPLATQAQVRTVDATPAATAAIAAAPTAPGGAPEALPASSSVGPGPLSARGNVTDLGGASAPAADRVAQLNRDSDVQRSLSARALETAQQGVGGPTPGMGVIGPVDYANRNADFNDSAQMRTVLARGAAPGRGGAQAFQDAVQGAAMPLAQRAQQQALQTKEQGDTNRAQLQEQGLAARARVVDSRQQEANSIDRAKLGVDIYKSDQAARVAGAKAGLTEDQAKSAGYAVRMENALKLIGGVGATNPGATQPGLGTALVNVLPEALANKVRPEDRQRVEAAQLDALDAALTLNTGAAYTKEQLQGLSRSYFAQPGDADKTVSEKQQRLNSLIDTARLRAGPSGGTLADTAVQKATAANGGGAPPARAHPDDINAILKKYGGPK